jgi:succinoglycan biosynthesis transport protein ExoP
MTDDRNTLPGAQQPEDDLRLHEIWLAIRRHRWMVVAITVLGLGAAAGITWRQRPVYEGEAVLRIDEQSSQRDMLSDMLPMSGGRGKIPTEMVVLHSRQIAEAVVDSLALNVQLLEPAAPRGRVLRVLRAPAQVTPLEATLERREGGAYTLTIPAQAGKPAAAPRVVTPGTPFTVGGVTLALVPAGGAAPQKVRIAVRTPRQAVEGLRGSLEVARPDPDANVVVLRYRTSDPQIAAAVPNEIGATFIEYKAVGSRRESTATVRFLRDQVTSYEQQLRSAEESLRSYRESQQVVSLTEEASEQVKRLAELQAEYDGRVAEREALAKLLTRVSQNSPGHTSEYRQLASFPVFLGNKAVQDLLQNLTELENARAQKLTRRTETNEEVQSIDERVHQIELQMFQIARDYQEGLNNQIASAQQGLARFRGQLGTIPEREVEFARLQRRQNLIGEIYTQLQTRLKEAEIREAAVPSDVRLIDAALVPESPIYPRPLQNMLVGLFAGLLLGFAAAFLRDALDSKVRTRDDAHALTAGLPILAMIPHIRMPALANGNGNGNGNGKLGHGRKGLALAPVSVEALREMTLITRREPQSPVSEAYRSLRTGIMFSSLDHRPQVLVVTSALPGDGKSTISSNLAITFAQQGNRTLLIDADLRNGLLHRTLGVEQQPGLSNVLYANGPVDEVIHSVDVGASAGPLHFVSSGAFPPNPSEMLSSERMKRLIAELRERYDVVIFDAPPLNLVTDAALLGLSADATLLVARAGITPKAALQHAAGELKRLHISVAGTVLNDLDDLALNSYGYGGYGYGYGRAAET